MAKATNEEIEKAREFLREVRAVCQKHGMQIAVSGYDGLVIFALHDREPELHCASIELHNSDVNLF